MYSLMRRLLRSSSIEISLHWEKRDSLVQHNGIQTNDWNHEKLGASQLEKTFFYSDTLMSSLTMFGVH